VVPKTAPHPPCSISLILSSHLTSSAILATHLRHILRQPAYVKALELRPDVSREVLLVLMGAFDSNLWASATEALYFLWMGRGLCYWPCQKARLSVPHERPFDVGSTAIIAQLAGICHQNGPRASRFINNLLNHLNWIIAELSQIVGELRPAAESHVGRERDANYARCHLLHEVSVRLMRVLEGLALDASHLFIAQQAEAETNLIRVLEVTLHVLDRTLNPSQFAAILDGDLLAKPANRYTLLFPSLGTLMALVKAETGDLGTGLAASSSRVLQKVRKGRVRGKSAQRVGFGKRCKISPTDTPSARVDCRKPPVEGHPH
jgi:hypothetical protein